MSPSLAQLVKKWLKTYSTKNNWEFSYDDNENVSVGFLMYWRDHDYLGPRVAIKIEKDEAMIGQWSSKSSGLSEWQRSIYSDVKLIAADPRFFAKLDRMMQFLTRVKQRRAENEKKFAQEEISLLKDILR
jgi:hypothetical protein